MSHATKTPNDPKLQERIEKVEKHDHRIEHIFRRILHWIERGIAAITVVVMVVALAMEVYHMVTVPGYMTDSQQSNPKQAVTCKNRQTAAKLQKTGFYLRGNPILLHGTEHILPGERTG